MSKVEEIEQAVERLPLMDFVRLAAWVDNRRQELSLMPVEIRDHSAFLNSYSPGDDGLYDDAATG